MSSQSQKFLGSYFQQQKPRGGPIERKRSKLSQADSASGAEEPKDMRPQGAHDGFVEAELDVRQTTGQEGASLGSIGAYGRNAEGEARCRDAEGHPFAIVLKGHLFSRCWAVVRFSRRTYRMQFCWALGVTMNRVDRRRHFLR
jgi:hypothetical protein